MTSLKQNIQQDSRGMVSILVTILIMLIISLIIMGFARLVRREQNQSLDRQLSTQAFYAAETGVNDAIRALDNNIITGPKTTCDPTVLGATPILDTGVEYTCVLINPTPDELTFKSVGNAESTVFPIRAANNAIINTIKISWQQTADGSAGDGSMVFTGCSSLNTLPPNWPATNCDAGLLRVDLVPFSSSTSRDLLIDRTFTAFLYPRNSGGVINYTEASGLNGVGAIVGGNCTGGGPFSCNVTITNNLINSSQYYARIRSIYKPSKVIVTAQNGVTDLDLAGAQAVIDSTGKAVDVLRRIQVKASLVAPPSQVPDYALQLADGFCKRFGVAPPDFVSSTPGACDPTTAF